MKKYISFGYFNKEYFIIFIISLITASIGYLLIIYIDKLTNNNTKIRANKLLSQTLTYIGQFLSFIPLIISKKSLYSNNNNKSINESSIEIKYIYNYLLTAELI